MPSPSDSFSVDAACAWFGVDRALCARVLAAALDRGGDYADLYFQHRRACSIHLEDGLISHASTSVDRGVGIRVVRGDQTGYAYSEDLELEPILHAAKTAAAIAAGNRAVEPPGFGLRLSPDLYPIAEGWDQIELSRKLPLLSRIEGLAHARESAIVKVSVGWADADERVLVATSTGELRADRRPMSRIGLTLTAKRGDEVQSGGSNIAGRRGLDWYDAGRLDELVRDAVDRTMILFEAVRPPAGEMPVVLAAGASGILLHEAIGHGMEADFNRKGVSIYARMLGERVAAECVTVVDSALHPYERGALNFDDEASEVERTVLVDGGILRSYLHDRISARHYGVASTGSGRRESFRHVPMPRMRCTYMENGPHAREEIIASVSRGILAETFSNGQVQIGAGDFTFYIKNGWLIEGGRLTAPIKDVNIIGNGPQALRDVTMVANDLKLDTGGWTCGKDGQSVPVSQGMPTALVSKLTVGGRHA
ncbi:MAG: TldD/PmbA family protein [Planctomycetes bacterium]|nr:TldD/PmbA family protein [Planctomycetota bacterium]